MVTYRRSEELDDDMVEQLLADRLPSSTDLHATASLVSAIRSMSNTTPAVVSAELADIFERGLASGDGVPPVVADRRAAKTMRRHRVPKSLSALLATLAGKVVLGTVAVAAGVGGAQAGGVVDVPGLPDRAPTTAENAPANDDGAGHSDEGSDVEPAQPDDPGVDGGSVSERAKDGEPQEDGRGFGSSVSEDAVDGTPAEDTPAGDRPTDPGNARSNAPAGGSGTADESRPESTPHGRP